MFTFRLDSHISLMKGPTNISRAPPNNKNPTLCWNTRRGGQDVPSQNKISCSQYILA